MDRKNNFRSFTYGQSSTNPENFVKFGLADVEIIGLTEITKNIKSKNKTPPKDNSSSPAPLAKRVD